MRLHSRAPAPIHRRLWKTARVDVKLGCSGACKACGGQPAKSGQLRVLKCAVAIKAVNLAQLRHYSSDGLASWPIQTLACAINQIRSILRMHCTSVARSRCMHAWPGHDRSIFPWHGMASSGDGMQDFFPVLETWGPTFIHLHAELWEGH